jgi:hypothetical protein
MDYSSVEQGCMQVLSTQILMQTPLHLLLPSMMFVTVFVSHRFFGNGNLAEQVATREHPAYLKSGLRLSRLVSTGRINRLGVSASEDTGAYSCHLAVRYHLSVLRRWIQGARSSLSTSEFCSAEYA